MDLKDIAEQVRLDNLEEVLAEHSILYEHYTHDLPQAKKKRDAAKFRLEEEHARLFLHHKNEALVKLTKDEIVSRILMSPEYKEQQWLYLEAKEAHDEIEWAKEFFAVRESTIKNLVHLYGSQYWSLHGVDKDTEKLASAATRTGRTSTITPTGSTTPKYEEPSTQRTRSGRTPATAPEVEPKPTRKRFRKQD